MLLLLCITTIVVWIATLVVFLIRKKIPKTLVVIGTLLGLLILWTQIEGTKKLSGTHYALFYDDVSWQVQICHYYEGEYGEGLITFVKDVHWNDKYIVVRQTKTREEKDGYNYYIIEQLETDTFHTSYSGKKIPWTTYNRVPWKKEKYEQKEDLDARLEELNIDTMQMKYYTWKYWVGIY